MGCLFTRSDFDGLVCSMLFRELGLIDDIKFVHPKDVQDGRIDLTENDYTANLPFDSRVKLAFDHHSSEMRRINVDDFDSLIFNEKAKSSARVLYDYYGGNETFKTVSEELMLAVDKCSSADFTLNEILRPTGWVLLNFIMDARTGLGRYHNFTISNYDLMMKLIDYCRFHTIDKILELPDVQERVDLYFKQQELFKAQIERVHKITGDTVIIDLRNEDPIYIGNRFLVYVMYPNIKVSVHIVWGRSKQNTAIMIGKSILNKTLNVDVGDICLNFGGGGHANAGTCQLSNNNVDLELPKIIMSLNNL